MNHQPWCFLSPCKIQQVSSLHSGCILYLCYEFPSVGHDYFSYDGRFLSALLAIRLFLGSFISQFLLITSQCLGMSKDWLLQRRSMNIDRYTYGYRVSRVDTGCCWSLLVILGVIPYASSYRYNR